MNIDVIKRRVLASELPQKYLLDEFPNARLAYSLRRLRKDHNGPVIRLWKSGPVFKDIFFDGDYIDISEVDSFFTGTDVHIDLFYDQTLNQINTTSRGQGGLLLRFANGNYTFIFNQKYYFNQAGFRSSLIPSQTLNNFSFFAPYVKTFATNQLVFVGNNNPIFDVGSFDNTNFRTLNESDQALFPFNQTVFNVPRLASFFKKGNNLSDIFFYNNGQLLTGSSGVSFGQININTIFNRGLSLTGTKLFSEIILYDSDQLDNRLEIEQDINDYYGIF